MVSNKKIIDLEEPYLIKIIFVEINFHSHNINVVVFLYVSADFVAYFETVKQGSLLLEILVIFTKLFQIKLCLAIKRHSLIIMCFSYFSFLFFKARSDEVEREVLLS